MARTMKLQRNVDEQLYADFQASCERRFDVSGALESLMWHWLRIDPSNRATMLAEYLAARQSLDAQPPQAITGAAEHHPAAKRGRPRRHV